MLFAFALGLVVPQASATENSKLPGDRSEEAAGKTLSLLSSRCLECHDADTAEGGYVLATVGTLKEAGDSGKAAVLPGDAEASELFRRLVSEDPDERMPAGGPAFSAREIEQVRRWIDSGANTGRWGAEQPLSEIASVDSHSQPAPERYPRPIPVVALAVSEPQDVAGKDGFGEGQAVSSRPAKPRAAVVVGGYRELLWLHPNASAPRQRLGGFGRFVATIEPHPNQRPMAVAHGEPGVRGLVTLVQPAAEGEASMVDCWSGSDLPGDIAFSPQGERLAIGGRDGSLTVIEIDSGKTVFASTPHADAILGVAWSADGKQVLTASRDRTARAVRLEDGRAISNFTSHERAVFAVAAADAGILTMDETGTLRLWSEGSKQPRIQRQLDRSSTVGMVVHENRLFVAQPQQIVRTRVTFKDVGDGKDKEGKPKTRTIPEWQDEPPLTLDAPRIITSLAVDAEGTVWAGTHDGMIYRWRHGTASEPIEAFPQ